MHLEADVFDLMTKWIERYRRQAEERFQRLDAVLAEMQDDEPADAHEDIDVERLWAVFEEMPNGPGYPGPDWVRRGLTRVAWPQAIRQRNRRSPRCAAVFPS